MDAEKKKQQSSSSSSSHPLRVEKKQQQPSPAVEQHQQQQQQQQQLMSILEEINKVARLDEVLPLVKSKDLQVERLYHVDDLKFVNTEWGRSVMASLDGTCWIFLPKRLSLKFLDNERHLQEFKEVAEFGLLSLHFFDVGRYRRCEFIIGDGANILT